VVHAYYAGEYTAVWERRNNVRGAAGTMHGWYRACSIFEYARPLRLLTSMESRLCNISVEFIRDLLIMCPSALRYSDKRACTPLDLALAENCSQSRAIAAEIRFTTARAAMVQGVARVFLQRRRGKIARRHCYSHCVNGDSQSCRPFYLVPFEFRRAHARN
jgi:hypothetical protein